MSLEKMLGDLVKSVDSLSAEIRANTEKMKVMNGVMPSGDATGILTAEGVKTAEEFSEMNNSKMSASKEDKATADKINAEAKEKALKKSEKKAEKAAKEKADEVAEQKSTVKKILDAVNEVELEEVSADDLKAACLKASRAKEGNKVKVKALLAKYDAKIVKDVAIDDRATILNLLESGKF